jgi:hypothetical protein
MSSAAAATKKSAGVSLSPRHATQPKAAIAAAPAHEEEAENGLLLLATRAEALSNLSSSPSSNASGDGKAEAASTPTTRKARGKGQATPKDTARTKASPSDEASTTPTTTTATNGHHDKPNSSATEDTSPTAGSSLRSSGLSGSGRSLRAKDERRTPAKFETYEVYEAPSKATVAKRKRAPAATSSKEERPESSSFLPADFGIDALELSGLYPEYVGAPDEGSPKKARQGRVGKAEEEEKADRVAPVRRKAKKQAAREEEEEFEEEEEKEVTKKPAKSAAASTTAKSRRAKRSRAGQDDGEESRDGAQAKKQPRAKATVVEEKESLADESKHEGQPSSSDYDESSSSDGQEVSKQTSPRTRGRRGGRDGRKAESCHRCKNKKEHWLGCPLTDAHRFCQRCVEKHFGLDFDSLKADARAAWPEGCPICQQVCPCASCQRKRTTDATEPVSPRVLRKTRTPSAKAKLAKEGDEEQPTPRSLRASAKLKKERSSESLPLEDASALDLLLWSADKEAHDDSEEADEDDAEEEQPTPKPASTATEPPTRRRSGPRIHGTRSRTRADRQRDGEPVFVARESGPGMVINPSVVIKNGVYVLQSGGEVEALVGLTGAGSVLSRRPGTVSLQPKKGRGRLSV